MDLSRNLLKAFSDISNPKQEKKEIYLYATAKVDSNGNTSVRIDGSTVDTPVESTAEIKNGERVLVTIDNNKAILVGNMSSPAARVGTVEEVKKVATNADTKAVEAKKVANEAEKQATNFIGYTDEEGLLLGYKGDGTWKGFRSQLLSNQFNILDEEGVSQTLIGPGIARIGTAAGNNVFVDSESVNICNGTSVLALFDKDEIKLDVNPYGFANMTILSEGSTSTIKMCHDAVSFIATVNDDDTSNLHIKSEGSLLFEAPVSSKIWAEKIYSGDGETEHWSKHMTTYIYQYNYENESAIVLSANYDYSNPTFDPDTGEQIGSSTLWAETIAKLTPSEFSVIDAQNNKVFSVETDWYGGQGTIKINGAITSESDIDITTKGVVKLNGDRIMKATLPDGGYWGMVAPSGADNVWLRTTSAGILPYAIDNTSKIGSASWKFSEGHFASIFATSIYTGSKKSASDGVTGVFLSKNGRIALQNTTGNPYISFYGPDATESEDCYISYNIANDYLQFGGATQYNFGNTIYSAGAVRAAGAVYAGYGTSYSVARGYYFPYKDGEDHSCVYRAEDGLTTYYGWAGSSSYATVGVLRGRTVKYANSSGTTTLSDERLKKDFESLDRWDTFFDTIEPCAFKMKHGNSGRFHIGFKAQQIEEALIQNGLSTQDFAGFIRMPYTVDPEDPETTAAYEEAGIKPGDDELGLLYSEFTALNTYEIQKLKKRIDELEALIKEKNNERETN